jgi:hypothetical protein
MERARLEQLGGMQRNPVEGLKQGPEVLQNLYFEKAGGYLPFAAPRASAFLSLGAAFINGVSSYDALGNLVSAPAVSASEVALATACGSSLGQSFNRYSFTAGELLATVPRFGGFFDRRAYFGHGLADGSMLIEPAAAQPVVEQDALATGGFTVDGTESVALTYAPGTGAELGVIYLITPGGVLSKIELGDDEPTVEFVANVSGSLGAAVRDILYGNGWLVVLGANSRAIVSNDEFATVGSTSNMTDANMRLSWDRRNNRFYAGGDSAGGSGRLFRTAVVSPSVAPSFTQVANNIGLFTVNWGAGVAALTDNDLVAPFRLGTALSPNTDRVAYSRDGGANWSTLHQVPGAFQQEAFPGGTGVANHVAASNDAVCLAVTERGNVVRRKDALLGTGTKGVADTTWSIAAREVDGEGVALNSIIFSAETGTWFTVSENGGVFESRTGDAWTEVGRVGGALTRIAVDSRGNWYASGPTQPLVVDVSAIGAPVGRYVVAALATIPTTAGDIVTDYALLEIDITEANPSIIRVTVPDAVTEAWLATRPAAEREAYDDNVRVQVYVGYDEDFLQDNPRLFLVKSMKLGDEPFLIRSNVVEGVSSEGFQGLNLLTLRGSITETHLGRVWFTIPEKYEIDPVERPVPVSVEPAGENGYLITGSSEQFDEVPPVLYSGRVLATGGMAVDLAGRDALRVLTRVGSYHRLNARTRLTGVYLSSSVDLAPGASATVVLPPQDPSSGLVAAEVTLTLNGAGNLLTISNVVAVTPVTTAAYGTIDLAYLFRFDLSFPGETQVDVPRLSAGGPDVINTELQITSEGGPFTVAWTEAGFMNLAEPLNFLKISSSTSTSITDLASGPGQQLYVFLQNEIFAIYGDPDLDLTTRIENFGVRKLSGVVGHDSLHPVARLGNELYCVHRGQVYGVGEQGISEQPISAPIDKRSDPIVQVVGDSRHNHLVARTLDGVVLRYDVEKQGWFEDPWSEQSVSLLLPTPQCDALAYGARYVRSNSVFGVVEIGDDAAVTARFAFTDLDLGEKNINKLWRRIRLHTSDDLDEAPFLTYIVRGQPATVEGRLTEDGVWVFTLNRGAVGPKITLDFTLPGLGRSTTIEPPVDIEFVPRYLER